MIKELIELTQQEIKKHIENEDYYGTEEDIDISNSIYENALDLKIINDDWGYDRLKYDCIHRYGDLLEEMKNKEKEFKDKWLKDNKIQLKEMCVRKTEFKKVGVGFEKLVGYAFINPKYTWNGWLVPFVLEDDIESFVKNFNKLSMVKEKQEGSMWLKNDVLHFCYSSFADEEDEVEKIELETITITNGTDGDCDVFVYNVGLGLVWDKITH